MFLDVVVAVEFENVHGKYHTDEVAKGLCAYGDVERSRVSRKCRQASIPSLCGILV